jgi:hypothetical protein
MEAGDDITIIREAGKIMPDAEWTMKKLADAAGVAVKDIYNARYNERRGLRKPHGNIGKVLNCMAANNISWDDIAAGNCGPRKAKRSGAPVKNPEVTPTLAAPDAMPTMPSNPLPATCLTDTPLELLIMEIGRRVPGSSVRIDVRQ